MSYTFANRKRADGPAVQKEEATQPAMDALRSGTARPTQEQMGHRVDLPSAMRSKMENAFGADLSAVKLYESQTVADAGAKAITQGASIAFAPGLLDFTSYGGQALLGHELSHVVSQARGEVTGSGFLNDGMLEARADREGAMAASGQTVAMPAASLSPVTAAAAAGPMQAKDKDKSKKNHEIDEPIGPAAAPKQDVKSAPGTVTLEGGQSYKFGGVKGSSSVMGVNDGGDGAVVKMGVDKDREIALAELYNMGGRTFDTKHGGSWSFDAPAARGVNAGEEAEFKQAIHDKKLRSLASQDGDQDEVEARELAETVIYSKVNGEQRLDDRPVDRAEAEAKGRTPLVGNPMNRRENDDYQRAMGYTSMLDLITGNGDRTLDYLNTENWMENRDSRQIHLLDHDHQWSKGVGRSEYKGDPKEWLGWLTRKVGEGGKGADSARDMMKGVTSSSKSHKTILGNQSGEGAAQALSDLPGMQKRLRKRFIEQNGDEKLNDYQQEILDRMQISHEYMTDPEMAEIYRGLADTGFKARKDDTDEIVERRKNLLAQRDARRAHLAKRKKPDLSLD